MVETAWKNGLNGRSSQCSSSDQGSESLTLVDLQQLLQLQCQYEQLWLLVQHIQELLEKFCKLFFC